MKPVLTTLIILIGILVNSCDGFFNCLQGNGRQSSEERVVSSFTGIAAASNFDVNITYGTETSVTVVADENLLQYIRTYKSGGDLVLETEQNRCLESNNPIQVNIVCPYLESVVLSGSGDINIDNFVTDYFSVSLSGSGDIRINNMTVSNNLQANLSGSGDIELEGKAADAKYTLSGSGDIRAENMTAGTCNIILSGSGDIRCNFMESLRGILSGSGNVYFYGDNSMVNIRVTGSGDVIQR